MTETPALDLMAKVYNKKRLRYSKPTKKNTRGCYYITIFAGELRQTLRTLMKHIRVKKRQAELLYEAVRSIGPKRDVQVDERLEEIFKEMKALNRKGRKRGQH